MLSIVILVTPESLREKTWLVYFHILAFPKHSESAAVNTAVNSAPVPFLSYELLKLRREEK